MIMSAKVAGVLSDKMMWESVENLDEMLCILKVEHPKEYWRFIREQHGILYNNHYNKEFAEHDVNSLKYKNRDGKEVSGPYWTSEQIEVTTKNMTFPPGTTIWDKYVAFNAWYSDLCTEMEDTELFKSCYKYFFADEDAPKGKIWVYMEAMKTSK